MVYVLLYRATRLVAVRDHGSRVRLVANHQVHCLEGCRVRDRFHMRGA